MGFLEVVGLLTILLVGGLFVPRVIVGALAMLTLSHWFPENAPASVQILAFISFLFIIFGGFFDFITLVQTKCFTTFFKFTEENGAPPAAEARNDNE